MRCMVCQQEILDIVQFCTQCGGAVTTEAMTREATNRGGDTIQLYASFLRIIHRAKHTVTQVVDIAFTDIGSVTIGARSFTGYLQILRHGEVPPQGNTAEILAQPGTLSFRVTDAESFFTLYQELPQRCPQAVFSSCLDIAAFTKSPAKPQASNPNVQDGEATVVMQAEGIGETLFLLEDRVRVRRTGRLNRGDQDIFLTHIGAIEYKPADRGHIGSLQFVQNGANTLQVQLGTVNFKAKQQPVFDAIRRAVEVRIQRLQQPPPLPAAPPSTADELAKLAALREQGILTDEEFVASKRRLLDI